jgi:hypothetical protein
VAGLDGHRKSRLHRDSIAGPSSQEPGAITTTLPCPPLTCDSVFILIMFVTRKCSRSGFLSLFERQNMRKVYTVGGKRVWY